VKKRTKKTIYIVVRNGDVRDPIVFERKDEAKSYEKHYRRWERTLLMKIPWDADMGQYGPAKVLQDHAGPARRKKGKG